MTSSGNGHDDDDRPEGSGNEPRGLAGVDVQPMPPLDREQAEALRRENDELRDQLLRKRAEFENYRKRVERERQQAGAEAVADLLTALIPTLDNLDRALSSAGGGETLRQGVELTRRELLALLERQGVKVEDPLGQSFDPERHQALSHEVVPGKPEGTVVEVFRKGYSHKDRLLRPALVKVAKGSDAGEAGPDAVH
ncbi:MAG: nucleotide exchange factor GrpE [Acidobacteria bacterium]|nr:MAG: nucleotide exchange factor GrpE [Acidobacteriota bacterium]